MNRKVAKLIGPKKFEIRVEPIPNLADYEVLMKVIAVGLCHSDMPAYKGRSNIAYTMDGKPYMETDLEYPMGVGHEPIGIIEKIGSKVINFKPGDYVGGLVKGAFASHLVTNENRLIKVPPSDNKEIKYCLPEPLMCIANILRAANPNFGESIGVIGCGMMGLLCIAGLSKNPLKEIVAIDLSNKRLQWAQKMGATTVVNPKEGDVVAEIHKMTGGKGLDTVIEITGSIKGLNIASSIISEAELFGYQGRGKIIMSSLYASGEVFEPSLGYNLMFKSAILHSVHPWYSRDYMNDARIGIWGYQHGHLPLDKLITHQFKLDEIDKAFEIAEKSDEDYIKGIVIP
jgi:threonine dehydrogenase-like Zn-dependent dehydrogenase